MEEEATIFVFIQLQRMNVSFLNNIVFCIFCFRPIEWKCFGIETELDGDHRLPADNGK